MTFLSIMTTAVSVALWVVLLAVVVAAVWVLIAAYRRVMRSLRSSDGR